MALKRYSKETLMAAIANALDTGKWIPSGHAAKRMSERNITAPELEYILRRGFHNPRKDERTETDWKYAIDGETIDKKRIRIGVLFDGIMVVVTVIDLDLD